MLTGGVAPKSPRFDAGVPFVRRLKGTARRAASRRWLWPAAVALLAAAPTIAAPAAAHLPVDLQDARDNRVCFGCHADASKFPPTGTHSFYVDPKTYQASVHAARACTDCHTDITAIPHGRAAQVECSTCHPSGDRPIAVKKGTASQLESAHARALRLGKPNAPGCPDCHGSHDILAPKTAGSRVNRVNIPATCGRCHLEEYRLYRNSIHGQAIAKGKLDAAVCTDCHGEHSRLLPPDSPASSVYPLRVPNTCSRCHDSKRIVEQYGLPSARGATYRDSYHGIITKYGDKKAANCASCHGFHDILPSRNPDSRVNHAHLAATCGQKGCHEGASENFARGTVHLMPTPKRDAPIYWVRAFYRLFVFGLIAQFLMLIALDLLARRREARRGGDAE